jgi:hypothetical protein
VKKDDNSMISIEDKNAVIGVHEDEDINLFVYLQKQYDSFNQV